MPIGLARSVLTGYAPAGGATRTPKTFTTSNITYSGSSQFGSYSASFNGTSSKAYAANNSDFLLGDNDFTIEFWFYTADTVAEIINQQDFGTNKGWSVGPRSSQRMLFAAGTGSTIGVFVPATGGYSDNTWTHCAMSRSGSSFAIWTGGTRKLYTTTYDKPLSTATTDPFYIGTGYGVSSGTFSEPSDGGVRGGYFYSGLLDEIRISNTARYTPSDSTITPPTAAFTNDANTVLLMHFENNFNDDGGPQ